VSAVYPTRLKISAFVDWLLGLYDRLRLRLFNRNHSTVSIKECTTVKPMQMGLLPHWTRNNRVSDEVARDDGKPMGKRTKGNTLASWIYDNHRP